MGVPVQQIGGSRRQWPRGPTGESSPRLGRGTAGAGGTGGRTGTCRSRSCSRNWSRSTSPWRSCNWTAPSRPRPWAAVLPVAKAARAVSRHFQWAAWGRHHQSSPGVTLGEDFVWAELGGVFKNPVGRPREPKRCRGRRKESGPRLLTSAPTRKVGEGFRGSSVHGRVSALRRRAKERCKRAFIRGAKPLQRPRAKRT